MLFWYRWQRFFGAGTEKTVLGFRRFESAATGAPEMAFGKSLSPCLPEVDSELALHLHPVNVLELNAPEFRAVWKTLDGAPELYAALISNLDVWRARRPGMPRQDT